MESLHTKDCNHSKVSSPNFESFESKDSDLDESTNEISESFDTKLGNDTKVSSRKFESFESKHPENDSSADRILKVSSGNFESFDTKDCENSEVSIGNFESSESKDCKDSKVSIGNFESSESKVLKIDGRTKPRTQKQTDTFKKNFSKSKSLELKIQELDLRMRHLQSLVLRLM